MASPATPQHAGVRLDPSLAEGTMPAHTSHADVEPIPWKTGKVGVVAGIDAVTWASTQAPAPAPAQASASASAPVAAKAPAKPKKKLPGSGIPPRRIAVILKWARRISQVGFFALFMYFLFQTTFRGSFAARADQPVRLPLPVEGFLLADPFVLR
jgi:hypothetical protein